MKIAFDRLLEKKEKREGKNALEPVLRVYITLENHIDLEHLKHRNGQRGEFQTTVSKSHEPRKSLIRVFRLNGLKWYLYRVGEGGELTRLPKVLLALDKGVDLRLRSEAKRGRRRGRTRPERVRGSTLKGPTR
jgi:hypothetical protein